MKALELTVYPPAECICELSGETATGYNWNCDVLDHGWMGPARAKKRFMDAELAAEYHAANSDAWRAHSAKGASLPLLEERFGTLRRFTSLPHYDEADHD